MSASPGQPSQGGGIEAILREHERIRAVYAYYDASPAEQRKRDATNPGHRLNAGTRWTAISGALASLELRARFRLLDVGCGSGDDLRHVGGDFARHHPVLAGLDLLPGRILRARQAVPAAGLAVGGAEDLPFASGSFDVILVSTLFSSILNLDAARRAASEMARVLAADGTIICYDMRLPNPRNPHTRAITRRVLADLFPGARITVTPVTLLPPLARRVGGLGPAVYRTMSAFPPLLSHGLAVIRPGGGGLSGTGAGRPPDSPIRQPIEHAGVAVPTGAEADRDVGGSAGLGTAADGRAPDSRSVRPTEPGHSAGSHARPTLVRRIIRPLGHVTLVSGGLGLERAVTFAAVTILLRKLPEQQGGAFVLMLKIAGFTGALATLGLQGGAVRLVSGALGQNRAAWADALLRAFLMTRVVLAAGLIAGGLLVAPLVGSALLHKPSASPFIVFGCVSAATSALLMFSLHHLQARQAFPRYTALSVTASLTRMLAMVLLVTAGLLSAYRAAEVWALIPLVWAVAGLFLAPRRFLRFPGRSVARSARSTLIGFGRWLTVSAIFSVVFTNLDSLLVARFLSLRAVAWYGAAMNLSLGIVIAATALVTVLLPAISRLSDPRQIQRFFRRALVLTGSAAIAALPVVLVAGRLMTLIYGVRFARAAPAFQLLYVAALIMVIQATVSVIFLALGRPGHLAAQAGIQLAAALPCYVLLIPALGILGGAIGTLIGQAAALGYVLLAAPPLIRGRVRGRATVSGTQAECHA